VIDTAALAVDARPEVAALNILARAQKRLDGHIARRGIDTEALAIFATFERMYAAAVTPARDDLTVLVDATRPDEHAVGGAA
jgi:hypothetical protein